MLIQYYFINTERKLPKILCLKIDLASIGHGINEMWDAIDNIWANPLKQKSHQIFINNQHIIKATRLPTEVVSHLEVVINQLTNDKSRLFKIRQDKHVPHLERNTLSHLNVVKKEVYNLTR